MPRLILRNQTTASRRRTYWQVPQTDGITPALGEAGGQPQYSVNGGAWTSSGYSTLNSIGYGRYYADFNQSTTLQSAGTVLETRYSSGSTAETTGETVLIVNFDPSSRNGGSSQRLIMVNEPTPSECQAYFQLVGTDGITPATMEAGGQPQLSLDGAPWQSSGISTLTSIGDGRYFATLSPSVLTLVGTAIETRYASGNTSECPGDSCLVVSFDPNGPLPMAEVTYSPADVVRWGLIGLGFLTDPSLSQPWPAYVSLEPNAPNNCVTLYDVAGQNDGRTSVQGQLFQHYGVQLRVRATDHPTGWVEANYLRQALSQVLDCTVAISGTTFQLQSLGKIGTVLPLGKEQVSKRLLYTINFVATIAQTS